MVSDTKTTEAPGLRRELKARHLTMIAIGGSIGTGLFVASGATISQAGPGGALLSYILFEPVRKILEDRKNRIADEIDQAAADQAEAAKLKAEYDHKLKNVEKEADALMAQARKKALKREEEIVAGAKEEAARIIESANHEAELARINAQDQMKQEMVKMAVLMAGKFIQNQMDEKDQNAFVDQTLQEMGDKTWLQE